MIRPPEPELSEGRLIDSDGLLTYFNDGSDYLTKVLTVSEPILTT